MKRRRVATRLPSLDPLHSPLCISVPSTSLTTTRVVPLTSLTTINLRSDVYSRILACDDERREVASRLPPFSLTRQGKSPLVGFPRFPEFPGNPGRTSRYSPLVNPYQFCFAEIWKYKNINWAWTTTVPSFSDFKETFWIHSFIHSSFIITRTGEVGLGRILHRTLAELMMMNDEWTKEFLQNPQNFVCR